jgi:UrcA family protein
MKTTALVLASLLTGGIAATADATTPVQDLPQRVVSYGDLDLQDAADARVLVRRIKTAARDVCGLNGSFLSPAIEHRLRECAVAATARAVAEVNTRHEIVIRVAAVGRR